MRIIQIITGCVAALLLVACSGGGGDNSASLAKTENNNVSHLSPAVRTIIAAKNIIISTNIPWDSTNNAVSTTTSPSVDWVDPGGEAHHFTIDQISYQRNLAKCKEDFNYRKSDGDRLCYPQNVLTIPNTNPIYSVPHPGSSTGEIVVDPNNGAADLTTFWYYRYGYYCGAAHGITDVADERQPPHPLDPVDACCWYHDAQVWGVLNERNTDGMAMCVANAKARPVGLLSSPAFADMSVARAYWYRATLLADNDILPTEVPPPSPY